MARKKTSVGCLFWIALILLVLVIFLLNRNTIDTVLDKTGLLDYISVQKEKNVEPLDVDGAEGADGTESPIIVHQQVEPEKNESETVESDTPIIVGDPVEETTPVAEEGTTETESETKPIEPASRARRSVLYFVRIDENGDISLSQVIRAVQFVDSPLTDTLKMLLKGLTSTEISAGMLSLIPKETILNRVAIRDNTAFVDFNEAFRFNTFGKEGYRYQLQQVVLTAMEFQTVRRVQITIDGETIPYLGPESPFVGEPLTRDSFN